MRECAYMQLCSILSQYYCMCARVLKNIPSVPPKSLQMVTAPMKLKDVYSLEGKYDQPGQHIKKQGHYIAIKCPSSQGYGFSNSHVWM